MRVKDPAAGPRLPATNPPEGTATTRTEATKAGPVPAAELPDVPSEVREWFKTKGKDTDTLQRQIRTGLEGLVKKFYPTPGNKSAVLLQAQELLIRSGQLQGSYEKKKIRLSNRLRKKAKKIATLFELPDEDASEFVAMMAVSFGMREDVVYGE